jgi:hypothetical protein
VPDHDFSQHDLEAHHRHQHGGRCPNQKYFEQWFGVDDSLTSQLPRRTAGLEDYVDLQQSLLVLRALRRRLHYHHWFLRVPRWAIQ